MNDAPWYAHYPKDVPQQIDSAQYESLAELLDVSFKKFGENAAFKNMGKVITFSELKTSAITFRPT